MTRMEELMGHARNMAQMLESVHCELATKEFREFESKMKTHMYLEELERWLCYIADVAYDWDGYKNVKDLGELVDELRDFALKALKGETSPYSKGD